LLLAVCADWFVGHCRINGLFDKVWFYQWEDGLFESKIYLYQGFFQYVALRLRSFGAKIH
jgi:hypothetical protein